MYVRGFFIPDVCFWNFSFLSRSIRYSQPVSVAAYFFMCVRGNFSSSVYLHICNTKRMRFNKLIYIYDIIRIYPAPATTRPLKYYLYACSRATNQKLYIFVSIIVLCCSVTHI